MPQTCARMVEPSDAVATAASAPITTPPARAVADADWAPLPVALMVSVRAVIAVFGVAALGSLVVVARTCAVTALDFVAVTTEALQLLDVGRGHGSSVHPHPVGLVSASLDQRGYAAVATRPSSAGVAR